MKKFISLLLAFVLSLTLCIPAFAQSSGKYKKNTDKEEILQNFKTSINNYKNEDLITVQQDLEILNNYVGISHISISSIDKNNKITYAKKIGGNLTTYIQVEKVKNGATRLRMVEGTCYNVIEIMKDGFVFLDGKKVTVTLSENNEPCNRLLTGKGAVVSKGVGRVEHSDTPFGNRKSYEYTKYIWGRQVANVNAHKAWKDIGKSALSTVIGAAVGAAIGCPIVGTSVGVIFMPVAEWYKDQCDINQSEIAYFSFRHEKYEHGTNSPPTDRNYKYICDFYPEKDFGGDRYTNVFYERIRM